LAGSTRDGDSVSRLGGDEFSILLAKASEDDAMRVAARASECLKEPVVIGTSEINVQISTGYAVFPRDGTDAESLFRRADAAMYIAKRAHRSNVTEGLGFPRGQSAD
jgi:diguanylate cyclase (GGDEF)-like protein